MKVCVRLQIQIHSKHKRYPVEHLSHVLFSEMLDVDCALCDIIGPTVNILVKVKSRCGYIR